MAKPVDHLYYSVMDVNWTPAIASAGKVVCSLDWCWNTAPGLPDYDLISIWKGSGQYHIGADTYRVQPGTCLILRKGQQVIGEMSPSDPMTVIYMHFDYRDDQNHPIAVDSSCLPRLYRTLDQPRFFRELLEEALDAFLIQKDRDAAGAWLKASILHLLRQDARPNWTGYERDQAEAFKSLCARIVQTPGHPWRIRSLSKEFHCTPDHFGKLFRKYVGLAPGQFLIQTRINTAISLLRFSSHSITRIADILGYSDIFAFSRQFRQQTGSPPSDYRQNRADRAAP